MVQFICQKASGAIYELERTYYYRPAVLTGKPIIKGTCLAIEFIIDLLAHDWTESEILLNYPGLTH
ncbi:DUF433 domain-containing protein [Methanosarcina hadiensis]|uniref:DUF433 domain-containing protein n=1 Tax=Methanosarcina hadiensis TaxID=3078083 RepID=UPI003977725F